MIAAYLAYQFAGLWELVWYFGTGGVIVTACAALYVFTPVFLSKLFPNIQKTLMWVAAITVAVVVTLGIGVTLGEKRIQAQWDVARANAVEAGKKAHDDAVRDVARKPRRWMPNHRDRNLRD